MLPEPNNLAIVLMSLFLFGLFYAAVVALLRWITPDHGITAFLVVGGVTATLAGYACLFDMQLAMYAFLCFVASGLPMIAGDVLHVLLERRKAQKAAAEAIRAASLEDDLQELLD